MAARNAKNSEKTELRIDGDARFYIKTVRKSELFVLPTSINTVLLTKTNQNQSKPCDKNHINHPIKIISPHQLPHQSHHNHPYNELY